MRALWNGLEIDVPPGWADASTIVIAPRAPLAHGEKPSINLLVKRRPVAHDHTEASMNSYLKFMHEEFGELEDIRTNAVPGSPPARTVSFAASANGQAFRQYTMLFYAPLPSGGGEEVSATVTQLQGDTTPPHEVDKLLRSVRRLPTRGGR